MNMKRGASLLLIIFMALGSCYSALQGASDVVCFLSPKSFLQQRAFKNHEELVHKSVARPATENNRYIRILEQRGGFSSLEEFYRQSELMAWHGLQAFFGSVFKPDSPMGKAVKIAGKAGEEFAKKLMAGEMPSTATTKFLNPKVELLLELLEKWTREIDKNGDFNDLDKIQLVWLVKWALHTVSDILKKEGITFPRNNLFLSFSSDKNLKSMEASL